MIKAELYRDKKGEFRTRVKARNGRILFDSGEGYKTKAAALRALNSCVTVTLFVDLTNK